ALNSYRTVVLAYAAMGVVLALMFARLSNAVEASKTDVPMSQTRLGLHRSRGIVLKLSALFGLDAFAGGFVMQSFVAYWFHIRFGVETATLGGIFFGANLLAGVSALAAAWVARKIGLVNTMVFTHLPSNVLLILVPLMPNLPLVITWTTFVRVSFGFSLARCIEKLRDAKQSAGIADPADSRLQRLIIRFLGQWLQA